MATASSDCSARVYDVKSDFKELAVMKGHRGEVSKVCNYVYTIIVIIWNRISLRELLNDLQQYPVIGLDLFVLVSTLHQFYNTWTS